MKTATMNNYMTLIPMALLEFENLDILPPVRPNFVPKIACSSILVKTGKMNNEVILFVIMQMKFDDFDFWLLKAQFSTKNKKCFNSNIWHSE